MATARQFSLFLENRPGRLADVAGALAKGHVNILALDVPQVSEQCVLRLVVDDPGRARSLLKREGFAFAENEVLELDLVDVPGALAVVAHKLSKARINIEYAYGSTGQASGCTRLILQVSDLMRARKILDADEHPAAVHPFHQKPRYVNREGRGSGRH